MLGLPINNNQALPRVRSIQRQRSNWSHISCICSIWKILHFYSSLSLNPSKSAFFHALTVSLLPKNHMLFIDILLLCINHNCYLYCCCVSIIIVICICPPGALIWLINLFYSILYIYIVQVNIIILKNILKVIVSKPCACSRRVPIEGHMNRFEYCHPDNNSDNDSFGSFLSKKSYLLQHNSVLIFIL